MGSGVETRNGTAVKASAVESRGMKTMSAVKKRCEGCKVCLCVLQDCDLSYCKLAYFFERGSCVRS